VVPSLDSLRVNWEETLTSLRMLRFFALSGLSVAVSALALQACGGSDDDTPATTDAGTDAGKDTGADSGPKLPTEPLKVLNAAKVDVDADLSCMGKTGDAGTADVGGGDEAGTDGGTAPKPGDLVDQSFKIVEFGGGGSDIVVDADVDLFYKNTLLGGDPETKGKTDSKGLVTLKVPFGQRFTYRVNPNSALRTFVYFDSDAVTAKSLTGTYEMTAITKSKYDQFALAITGKTGFLTAPNTGIYSARVHDCAGNQVSNAVVEIVDAATGTPLPTGPGDADLKPVHYLTDNDLPSTGRYWTSRSGLVAAINVPETKAGGKRLKAIAKGLYGGSTELRKFAEVDLEITATAVNFRALSPK